MFTEGINQERSRVIFIDFYTNQMSRPLVDISENAALRRDISTPDKEDSGL